MELRTLEVYDVKAAALSKLTGADEQAWQDTAFEVIKLMIDKFGKDNYKVGDDNGDEFPSHSARSPCCLLNHTVLSIRRGSLL